MSWEFRCSSVRLLKLMRGVAGRIELGHGRDEEATSHEWKQPGRFFSDEM